MLSQVVAKHKMKEKWGNGKIVEKWVGKCEKGGEKYERDGEIEGRFLKKNFSRRFAPIYPLEPSAPEGMREEMKF